MGPQHRAQSIPIGLILHKALVEEQEDLVPHGQDIGEEVLEIPQSDVVDLVYLEDHGCAT